MSLNGECDKLHILQQTLDLHVCCSKCCVGKTAVTFSLTKLSHQCSRNILLAKEKDKNSPWKLVGPRPEFPVPEKYVLCHHYTEGQGCTLHKMKCRYPRSKEEAAVWNFMKKECVLHSSLITHLSSGLTSLNQQDLIEDILSRFQGAFVELCETCFRERPQKISLNVSDTCKSEHNWHPVLVFRSKDKHKSVFYDEIRPLSKRASQQWKLCRHTDKGELCLHSQGCRFPHSKIEMEMWKLESSKSLDHLNLVSAARSHVTLQEQKQQHYCYVCKSQFIEYEDFMNHCFSVEHRKLIFDDSTSNWTYRNPPTSSKALRLCRRLACEYGSSCMRAHSEEELKEWKLRCKAALKKEQTALEHGLLSYQDCLLEEYRQSDNKEKIMKESHPGVSINCDSDLAVFVRQENIFHQWKFNITSRSILQVVALLRREKGAMFALGESIYEERSYSSGLWFLKSKTSNSTVYEITVSFTCDQPGVYEQWLVFDFDTRPVLLQKLKVRVGMTDHFQQLNINQTNEKSDAQHSEQLEVIWHEKTVEVISYEMRSEADKELLKKYSCTDRKEFCMVIIDADLINHQNYKKKMHSFLYQEEMAQAQRVQRLNLRGTMCFKNQLFDNSSGLKNAISGELFGSIPVSYSLASDSHEGYMLKRHVWSVLVGLLRPDCSPQRVHEAVILKDVIGESELNVRLSNDCCQNLQLQSNTSAEMEVQFQLDRKWFCEMHKAVDMLPDLKRVLPDLNDRHVLVPVSIKSCSDELNEKQQLAMDFILGASNRKGSVAPLLIYGPFGTGKTLTLAKIALALVQQPQNKILICTHTNSSADLYVSDHFHMSATRTDHPVRPLRIKAKECLLRDDVTLQYCHLSKDKLSFEFPDKEILDAARIIITTTGMARFFHDLKLPSNYFSHIFIDEASQMLECEALMAIGLAGEKTQVILAGDHMQMGPRLFSVGVDKSSDYTLLNRLFHHYQAENTATAKNSRIIFNENYRSTQEIVDFVSKHFYAGKTDGIKAKGNVPAHPHQNALQFYHVRGECLLDKRSMSGFNPAEIQTVVNVVLNVFETWPHEWQNIEHASVCVLSQGSQVIEIRNQLKKFKLHDVTVENAENVQGKQFRVVIISTVHTKDSLNMTERPRLEFFNDVRLLNTAMTRAQSQVIIVGDAIALCCPYFGKCWRLWTSYINHCIGTSSAFVNEFTLNSLNQEFLEISNIIQSKRDYSDDNDSESVTSEISNFDEDPILKELLDEENDLQIKLTEDRQFPVLQTESFENNVVRHKKASSPPEPQQSSMKQNLTCKLIMDRYDSGFAIPLDEPSLNIAIKGKKNVGESMTGDVVIVDILSSETSPPTGKVVEVIKQDNLLREFVCTIDCNDDQVMMPVNICIPKIFTPFWKDKPNYIAIRNSKTNIVEKYIKINEEARRNLFVVKLLRWGKHFYHPLGIVVEELPRVTTLEKGLEVLRCEYNLNKTIPESVQREVDNLVHTLPSPDVREDFRDVMTFTIDPATSEDLDDAISVRDLGEHYEIGVHIADVASYVTKDSDLDKFVQKQGTTFYVSQANPAHMFPKDLITNTFSLLPGYERLCISLMTKVDKMTHKIKKRQFFKSKICSKKKLSYEAAEEILKSSGTARSFDTLEGCLAIACDFAEVHRKDRKQEDWCYRAPDEHEVVGSRRSHKLVEELMVMFNHTIADRLLFDRNTKSLTPLRCQDRPNEDQLCVFQKNNFATLSMSIHLSSKVDEQHENMMQQNYNSENENSGFDSGHFPILRSLLINLEIAERDKDIHRIVDLITTDDLHPHLCPLVIDFWKLVNKAQVLRASSSHLSRIGHYDLQLDSYTWASSPIRRYIDVIVQRLLLSVLDNTKIKYTSNDIDMCCVEFSQKNKDQKACDTKSHALSLASQLSIQNVQKIAYIVEVIPTGNYFRISFPQNRESIREMVNIMYRDLQLADQPLHYETNDFITLKWVQRIYSFSNLCIHDELKKPQANSLVNYVTNGHWTSIIAAIRKENWNLMFKLIRQIKSECIVKHFRTKAYNSVMASKTETEEKHYAELSLDLKKGEIIKVQLGTDTHRGLMVPAVQLLILNPKFEICIEHTKNPVLCFSKFALNSTKTSYNSYMEYQRIWEPLCEMESASSAVVENESIVVEDVTLKWKPFQDKDSLQGKFRLPLEKKNKWAIEGSLKNCFICIRLRIHQKDLGSNLNNSSTESQHLDLTNLPGLIWVAHAVVTNVSDEDDSKQQSYMEIQFRINHKPMTEIPQCVFSESSRFTLELIQKLLPDV